MPWGWKRILLGWYPKVSFPRANVLGVLSEGCVALGLAPQGRYPLEALGSYYPGFRILGFILP